MSITYTNQTVLTEQFSAAMARIWLFETESLESHSLWNIFGTGDNKTFRSPVSRAHSENSSHEPYRDDKHKSQPHK